MADVLVGYPPYFGRHYLASSRATGDTVGAWNQVTASHSARPPSKATQPGKADRHQVSLARIALAWLLAQGDDIVPIPGVKRRATLEDSIAAADLELSAQDLSELDAAVPPGAAAGDRYGERGMKMVRL